MDIGVANPAVSLQLFVMETKPHANGQIELAISLGYLLGNSTAPMLWSLGVARGSELGALSALFLLVSAAPASAAFL